MTYIEINDTRYKNSHPDDREAQSSEVSQSVFPPPFMSGRIYFGQISESMNRQQHGMLSLVLLGASAVLAFFFIGRSSILLAILYGCVLGLSGIAILYSFCAKCMCRDTTCGHVIPGLLTHYLPRRVSGRYSRADLAGIILPVIVSLAYPQYWLIGNLWGWSAFWIVTIGALVEIRLYVCSGCTHRYCPARRSPPLEQKKEPQGET
jgi:hypothetical protein